MSLIDKAKDLTAKNKDKVDQGIDKASEIAKQKLDPKHAEKIDKASGKAHDSVSKL